MEYKIIYGRYEGVEKKAIEFMSETVSNYVSYAVTATSAETVSQQDLCDYNIILFLKNLMKGCMSVKN